MTDVKYSAPVANRWCLASERDARATCDDETPRCAGPGFCRQCTREPLTPEQIQIVQQCAWDAEAREWALGVQVVAQAQRLRLAEAVVDEARYGQPTLAMRLALAAWDAVSVDVDPVDLG